MHELNKLFDDAYNVISCRIVKGFKNDKGIQLILKVGDIEIGKLWYEFERKPPDADRSKSRTGGKPSYYMVVERDLDKFINEKKPDYEILGYLWPLLSKTSWHTGLLKYKRKKKPLRFEDFIDIFGKSRAKTAEIVNKLKEYGILSHDKDGYKLSRDFIKKGRAKKSKENSQGGEQFA
jgi:hypothetical protein